MAPSPHTAEGCSWEITNPRSFDFLSLQKSHRFLALKQANFTLPADQGRDREGTCWQGGGAGGVVLQAVLRDSRSPRQCLDLRLTRCALVRALLHAGAFWRPICSSGGSRLSDCLLFFFFKSKRKQNLHLFFPSEIIYKALSLLLPADILWRHYHSVH